VENFLPPGDHALPGVELHINGALGVTGVLFFFLFCRHTQQWYESSHPEPICLRPGRSVLPTGWLDLVRCQLGPLRTMP
jgi:hypothetical protein